MFTAFVDMIGGVMIIPLLPFYAERLGANALLVGALISSFSVAQLVSAPLWGRISDRSGRRPVILGGLLLSAVAYVVFGFANAVWLLFVSRCVQGLGGGTVGVVQAYVADASHAEDRAKSLGWLSAATSFGAVIGPALGSYLAAHGGQRAPGIGAAVICLLNVGFAWKYLTEPRYATGEHLRPSQAIPMHDSRRVIWRRLLTSEPASQLVWTYTIAIGAFYGMIAVFTMSLGRRLGVTEKTIFPYFMWFGGSGVVFRMLVLGPAVRRLGEMRTARLGLVLLASGLALFPFSASRMVVFAAITLMPLGTALTFPCTTAMLSRVVPAGVRGEWLGVQQTMGGVSRVIFPLWDGWAFDHLGIATPFWSCAVLTLGSVGFLFHSGMRAIGARPATAAVSS